MQAWAGGLGPFLKRRGIAAIVNLRGRNDDLGWWKNETAIAQSAGIAHLDAMLDSRKLPTRAMLVQLIDGLRYRAAALHAQMLGRPGPHQLRRGALSHPSRRLERDGAAARQQFAPLSLSAFSQERSSAG